MTTCACLFARVGKVHCYSCDKPIQSQSVQQICDSVLKIGNDKRINVLAPIVRGKKGEFEKELEALKRQGYTRVIVDDVVHSLEDEIKLDKKKRHSISVFVDRLRLKDTVQRRLTDSLETAFTTHRGLGHS